MGMSLLIHDPTLPNTHPLLTSVGCPQSGAGAPLYLQLLAHSLEACLDLGLGARAQEWQGVTRQLSKELASKEHAVSASPTAADLTHEPWGSVHKCIEARRMVNARSTKYLDALFGQIVLHAAAGRKP